MNLKIKSGFFVIGINKNNGTLKIINKCIWHVETSFINIMEDNTLILHSYEGIHLHHVHASQKYYSYLTLVLNKELLLNDLLGYPSTILLNCFNILV
jgi:hypothetical protein